jgi:hypothetical protein
VKKIRGSPSDGVDWHSLFDYRDGKLVRKTAPSNFVRVGDVVGYQDGHGYSCVRRHDIAYKVHRVIYEMFKGVIPKGSHIDHINGDRSDNRIENLRCCSVTQNIQNSVKRASASSIYKGVYWCKQVNKWKARIHVNGVKHYLGAHSKEGDAALAYNSAAVIHFGEFANLNIITKE